MRDRAGEEEALEAHVGAREDDPTVVARLAAEVAGNQDRLKESPGRPPWTARASEVVYGVRVLEKMLEGPPPRVDPQAVAKPPPKSSPM